MKLSLPSAPSLANEFCQARESGSATPSTSTSTTRNLERIEGSLHRTDKNIKVDSGPLSSPEPDLALHNVFNQSQSSVTNDVWEKSAAVNCKGDLLCSVCKNKPPAVTLIVKPLHCFSFYFLI
jgi:hypothetical protein